MVELANRPVLDSDVLIDYLRGAGPGRDLVARLRDSLGYWVTAVTAFELALGGAYRRDPGPVDAVLAAPTLPLSKQAGLIAGAMLGDLRSGGHGLDIRDALQAGICLTTGLAIVTRNVRHFDRVPELQVFEPGAWEPGS